MNIFSTKRGTQQLLFWFEVVSQSVFYPLNHFIGVRQIRIEPP